MTATDDIADLDIAGYVPGFSLEPTAALSCPTGLK